MRLCWRGDVGDAPDVDVSGRETCTGSRHWGQGTNFPANFAFTAIAMPQDVHWQTTRSVGGCAAPGGLV